MSTENINSKPFLVKIIKSGVFLLLLTPFVFLNNNFFPFITSKSLFFLGVVEILFLLWLFLAYFYKTYRLQWNSLNISVVLFLLIMIVSSLTGMNPLHSFFSGFERMTGVVTWLHGGALFFILSSVFRRKEEWKDIFQFSLLAGVVFSAITFFDARALGWFSLSEKAAFTLGNTSFAGTYLLFNLFIGLYLLFNSRKKYKKYLIGGAILIILLSPTFFDFGLLSRQESLSKLISNPFMFLGEARAAALSFYGGLLLFGILYLIFKNERKTGKVLGGVLLISLIGVSVYGAYSLSQPDSVVREKFTELTTKSRLTVWKEGWQGVKERPWLGWGPENFNLVHQRYYNPSLFLKEYGGEVWFDRAHNVIFDKLVTIGFLGLAAYLSLFGTALFLLIKAYHRHKISFTVFGLITSLLAAYFMQNLTVFDMVPSILMFFLVLAFISGRSFPKRGFIKPKRFFTWSHDWDVVLVGTGLLVICLYYCVVVPFNVSQSVVASFASNNQEEKMTHYEYITEHSWVGQSQNIEYLVRENKSIFQENIKKVREHQDHFLKEFNYLVNELEKTVEKDPHNFRLRLTLIRAYNFYAQLGVNKTDLALKQGQEAIRLSPRNQQIYTALAQTHLYQNETEKAFDLIQKASDLEPRVERYQLLVVRIAKLMGDPELVEEKKAEARQHVPGIDFSKLNQS